ncbi:MAG: O-antigen ligase domain-containing protein, partial [Bacteroidales bacterium]|nr:O-antigen ligase domain-containing protein [Bacteroidales bacterium]
ITTLPNDSWFVKIWVETGIVGLYFHIGLLLFAVGYGAFIILKRIRDPELRGFLAAILSGLTGIIVSSYGNPIFVQYPTGIMMYMIQAFLFMGLLYDKEIETKTQLTENGGRSLA